MQVERNYSLIEEKMKTQADVSLRFGAQLIDEELKGGLSGLFVRPTVKFFYNYIAKKNLKEHSMNQLYIVLNTAKDLVLAGKGSDDPEYEEMIQRTIGDYVKNDSTALYCKKKNNIYPQLLQNIEELYRHQVKNTIRQLKQPYEVLDYTELCRNVYKSKDEAMNVILTQMDKMGEGIKFLEDNPKVLDVPVAKKLILKILRKGWDQTRAQFIQDIENDFPGKN